MNDLKLSHLLNDLQHRLQRLKTFLQARVPKLPSMAAAHGQNLLRRVERAIVAANALLAEPNIAHPALARHYFYDYKRLAEFTQQCEEWPAMVLERFGPTDERMSAIVARICNEIGYPHSPPLCASLSLQYFAAIPPHDLVVTPATVGTDLLSWPDIYHELGHFLLARHDKELLAPVRGIVDRHYSTAVAEAREQSWPTGAIDELERFRTLWSGSWILEFGSDLLATLLCGPAFGHANVRLSAVMSHDVFAWSESHPADDARSAAICKMLELMSLATDARYVDRQWRGLVNLCGDGQAQTYGLAFPDALLNDVVNTFHDGAKTMGLRSHSQGTATISTVLNEAWLEFNKAPGDYETWQRIQLAGLFS